MSKLTRFFSSTIGRRYLVGVTGLLLVLFLIAHLLGNLNVLLGPEAFNGYAAKLHSLGPILVALEIGLFLVFLIHIVTAIRLAMNNRSARGERDYNSPATKQNLSRLNAAPRTWMLVSGGILFAYLVYHIAGMKFGAMDGVAVVTDPAIYTATGEGLELGPRVNEAGETAYYRRVVGMLRSPLSAIIYLTGFLLLAFHLSHGLASSFRSIGLTHQRYTPIIRTLGLWFAILLALGFASIPIYIWVFGIGAAAGN